MHACWGGIESVFGPRMEEILCNINLKKQDNRGLGSVDGLCSKCAVRLLSIKLERLIQKPLI